MFDGVRVAITLYPYRFQVARGSAKCASFRCMQVRIEQNKSGAVGMCGWHATTAQQQRRVQRVVDASAQIWRAGSSKKGTR